MKKALFFSILAIGLAWILINIFYLPFFPWTDGLYRPWLILHGLVPYRDFMWIRTPFDIFFLAGLYGIFGVKEQIYQITIFFLISAISLLLLFWFPKRQLKMGMIAFIAYIILFFPLFSNSEIGEIIISLFSLLTFFFICRYNGSKKRIYFFLAGLSLGFSVVTKQTSALAPLLLIIYLYLSNVKLLKIDKVKNIFIYFTGLAIPAFLLIIYLLYKNALYDFLYYGIYFNLFIYSKWAQPWGIISSIKIIIVYFSILFPFLILDTRKIIDNKLKLVIFLLIFSLFSSVLPSFWSYRLVSTFPLICIALSVVVLEGYYLFFKHKKNILSKSILIISMIFFLVFFQFFLKDYVQFIKDNGFSFKQYILDYGENETGAIDWLKRNIRGNEKIFNMANNIIMLRSNHLPQNKYVDQIPVVYYPLDKSYKDIVANPPKIVVFDTSALDNPLVAKDWIEMYKNWKFISYLNKNYRLAKSFGTINIYMLNLSNKL